MNANRSTLIQLAQMIDCPSDHTHVHQLELPCTESKPCERPFCQSVVCISRLPHFRLGPLTVEEEEEALGQAAIDVAIE